MHTIQVDIVSAEEEIWSGQGTMVFVPGEMGELGIAPNHTQLLTRLIPGDIRIELESGKQEVFYISGGLLEVQPYLVTVLSDTAIRSQDLDQAAAELTKKRAEKLLSQQQSDMEYAKAKVELLQAIAQLRTIKKIREPKK